MSTAVIQTWYMTRRQLTVFARQPAYAIITLPNAASVALHEAAGFRSLAVYRGVGYKLGRWHDVGLFEQRLADLPTTPRPPRTIGEVWDPARLQAA